MGLQKEKSSATFSLQIKVLRYVNVLAGGPQDCMVPVERSTCIELSDLVYMRNIRYSVSFVMGLLNHGAVSKGGLYVE